MLVFSVTRVIFIPQGELVAFGALSMAALNTGKVPATLWLLLALSGLAWIVEAWRWQARRRGRLEVHRGLGAGSFRRWPALLDPGACIRRSLALQALTVLLLIMPLGPLIYRLAYRPLADATVLILLIVSVALHGVLVGLGLLFFGAEGSRTPAFSEARFDIGGVQVNGAVAGGGRRRLPAGAADVRSSSSARSSARRCARPR